MINNMECIMDEHKINEYAERLKKNGIIIIPNYWSANKCEQQKKEIIKVVESGDLETANDGMGYQQLVNHNGPIISERKGNRDNGMLDIFNMDMAISELSEFKNNNLLLEIINRSAKEEYSADNVNVYLNKSVTNTRGYHADTYSGKYKSFLYLTDVPDKSYGPFSFINGSHTPSKFQKKMRQLVNKKILNKPPTNALMPLKFREITCIAPKGTLIIANQTGLHRGNSQGKGKKRVLVTTSYTPKLL